MIVCWTGGKSGAEGGANPMNHRRLFCGWGRDIIPPSYGDLLPASVLECKLPLHNTVVWYITALVHTNNIQKAVCLCPWNILCFGFYCKSVKTITFRGCNGLREFMHFSNLVLWLNVFYSRFEFLFCANFEKHANPANITISNTHYIIQENGNRFQEYWYLPYIEEFSSK